jgi:LuxR family transcriptional regulator, maltose regulon positive regulatory protein
VFSRALVADLGVVDWPALRFTTDEAQRFAERKRVSQAFADRAIEQCDGWAAGLTLILNRAAQTQALAEDIDGDSSEKIFEYFASQLFDQAEAATREALMQAALMPEVTGPLAIAITGDPRAAEALEHMYRRQTFVYRRGRERPTYQFHPLFREFLLDRFRCSYSVERRQEVLLRAANLAADQGHKEPAIELLCEARAWAKASALVLALAPEAILQGRRRTVAGWIGMLPEELVSSEPWLEYLNGVAALATDPQLARARLAAAFEKFASRGDIAGQVVSAADLVETFFGYFAGYHELEVWTARLGNLLDLHAESLSPEHQLQAYSSFLLAAIYGNPGNPLISRSVPALKRLLLSEADDDLRLKGGAIVLTYCTATFDLEAGRDVVALLQRLAQKEGVSQFRKTWWFIRLGTYQFQLGEDAAALASLQEAGRLIAENGFQASDGLRLAWQTWLCAAMGNVKEASRAVEQLSTVLITGKSQALANLRYAQFVVCAHLSKSVEECIEHQIAAVRNADDTGLLWMRICHRIGLAFALIDSGRSDEARAQIAEMRKLMAGTCFLRYEAPAQLLEAYLDVRWGDTKAAENRLADALRTAREMTYSFEHRNLPRFFPELLAHALRSGVETDFVLDLIRRLRIRPPRRHLWYWPHPVVIRTLGAFEIRIDGEPVTFSRKAPRKPLALLKAIIAFGGERVPERRIVDVLWPDEEGDAAMEALRVAIHRLRGILGDTEVLLVEDGLISLNFQKCLIDTRALDAAVEAETNEADEAWTSPADLALDIYRGSFLPGEEEMSWTLSMRERARARFIGHVTARAAALEAQGQFERASAYYRRGIEVDDLAETFYQGLMRCHLRLGRMSEGMSVYRRLRQTLSVTLGVQPSPESQRLVDSIRQ